MVTFDVVMPVALFLITLASLFFGKRVENRLKSTFEEREFRARDAILFVVLITVAVSVIVFVPQLAILGVFLFSYSALLFTFSYLFSNMRRQRAQVFCGAFGVASLAAGIAALLNPLSDSLMFYGGIALCVVGVLAFAATAYEQRRKEAKARWYLAVLPPVLFVLLFFVFSPTPFWFPVMLDVFGIVFAVLITLYLASLFSWKATFVFAALLTIMDIILVLVTGVMVTAARQVSGLGLPVLISLPTIPLIVTTEGIRYLSLGLGDFFFAGILATTTYRKYGWRVSVISAATMSVSFGLFEILLLNTSFRAFPGTLMIICGWLPVVGWKLFSERKTKSNVTIEKIG